MKNLLSLLLTLLVLNINFLAQETKINELSVLGEGKYLSNEIISKKVKDINGNVCAGLVIQTDLTGLSFESNNGIVKIDSKPGEYLLFLSPNERVVKIRSAGFKPLQIILNDYGINLSSGKVWGLEVTGDKKLDLIPINILTSPPEAIISIDGELKGTGTTFQVSEGEHQVKIEKDGYLTIDQKIIVSSSNNLFDFNLEQLEPVKATIKSVPTDANIAIDGIDKGNTDKDLFLFPGSYSLLLRKSGYLDINESITVRENQNNIFSFNLSKNSVTLTLNVVPANSEVLINKENYTNKKNVELAPGRYLLEISKEGYNNITDYVELELRKPITKEINLTQKVGALQLTVQPLKANIKLIKDNIVFKDWVGSKILKGIPAGEYSLEISKDGFETKILEINLTEEKELIENIVLLKGNNSLTKTNNENSMIFVKGGWFEMGKADDGAEDEKPVHRVYVNSFYIDKYEVTVKEYREYCKKTGIPMPQEKTGGWNDNEPIVNVSYYDAAGYAVWIGERLPTEAEWEYAARGGNKSKGYIYSGSNNLDEIGWYSGNSGEKLHPVGMKKMNELGIYDMSGNVSEWCEDYYDPDYYKKSKGLTDPKGPEGGSVRVVRGGFYMNQERFCKLDYRFSMDPTFRVNATGFRCVKDK